MGVEEAIDLGYTADQNRQLEAGEYVNPDFVWKHQGSIESCRIVRLNASLDRGEETGWGHGSWETRLALPWQKQESSQGLSLKAGYSPQLVFIVL